MKHANGIVRTLPFRYGYVGEGETADGRRSEKQRYRAESVRAVFADALRLSEGCG